MSWLDIVGTGNCKSRLSIQITTAKMAAHAVLVGPRISTDAAEEAEISARVGSRHLSVVANKLLQARIMLGGPGVVVQIDESLFRHKPKVG